MRSALICSPSRDSGSLFAGATRARGRNRLAGSLSFSAVGKGDACALNTGATIRSFRSFWASAPHAPKDVKCFNRRRDKAALDAIRHRPGDHCRDGQSPFGDMGGQAQRSNVQPDASRRSAAPWPRLCSGTRRQPHRRLASRAERRRGRSFPHRANPSAGTKLGNLCAVHHRLPMQRQTIERFSPDARRNPAPGRIACPPPFRHRLSLGAIAHMRELPFPCALLVAVRTASSPPERGKVYIK